MWKRFSNIFRKNGQREAQEVADFLFALEKLANLAAAKARRNDNVMANGIVDWLEKLFSRFFALKEKDPRKFAALLEQGDFYESKAKLVVPGEELQDEGSVTLFRSIYKSDTDYAFAQNKFRERKMVNRFLNAFGRIWEAAVEAKNEDISRGVAYALERILSKLAAGKDNQEQIEPFLNYLNLMTYELITNNTAKKLDRSIYPLSVNTYINIVFNRFGGGFELDYLPAFDSYFLKSIRILINEKQEDVFEEFIHLSIDGILVPTHTDARLWNYELAANLTGAPGEALHRDIQDLEKGLRDVNSRRKLDGILEKLPSLEARLPANLPAAQQEDFRRTTQELREFAFDRYKYNNFLELIFDIGAYCLFKDRIEYIRYLWEYKQPPDSDSIWIGEDVIPRTIPEIIALYFRRTFPEREHDWWEGHHGKGAYYKKYFLLLIARSLKLKPSTETLPQIQEALARLNAYQLSDLEYFARGLVDMAKDLANEKKLLIRAGFQRNELNDLFGRKLVGFLEQLSPQAQQRIEALKGSQQISQAKVTTFKEQVLKGFNKNVVIRKIFESESLFDDQTAATVPTGLPRLGINHMEDKGAFFDEWHVSFGEIGVEYGQQLAAGEDLSFFEKITAASVKVEGKMGIEELLKDIEPANALILAQNMSLSILFQKKKSFRPEWQVGHKEELPNGFRGDYLFGGKEVPIFEHFVGGHEQRLIVLDKTRLGKFIQYSPLDAGELAALQQSVFYMSVVAPAEDASLMDTFFARPPEWLTNMGDTTKQREYLMRQVVIKIFERFIFQAADDFIGRSIEVGDEFAAAEWI